MKDAYDKIKILSEVLKNNWPILVLAFTALSSMATNAAQFMNNADLEAEKIKAVREVAIGFQTAMIEIEPKKVVKKSTCGQCKNLIKSHEGEYH